MPTLEETDAIQPVRYHFLDVGGLKYGECTLVTAGDARVLIDGGHRSDFAGQEGYRSIPEQLAEIYQGPPPHAISLLVVTHCHDDHIGCLLDLIQHDVIRPAFALVTDPRLGFGRKADYDLTVQDTTDARVALAAILREEDASDLSDADLEAFIDAVATVETRYASLLKALEAGGCKVIPYVGQALPQDASAAVAPTGLTLLGPSQAQLLHCAEKISSTNKEADEAIDGLGATADQVDHVQLYRDLVGRDLMSDARNPRGSGMNCQSITLAFGPKGQRALLAGDMQFTEPGIGRGDAEVERLQQAVVAAGPYRLFKTTHHTSHNGQDDAFLTALGSPPLIVHSGGLRDPKHPYPGTLDMLSGRKNLRFARTDRNGGILVEPHKNLEAAIKVQRGVLNDFSDNRLSDPPAEPSVPTSLEPPASSPTETVLAPNPQIIIIQPGPGPIELNVAGIEIRIGPPPSSLRGGADWHPPSASPGGGSAARRTAAFRIDRDLSGLQFVTNPNLLRSNIGRAEADAVLAAIEGAGGILVTGAGEALIALSAAALQHKPSHKGVVLLGGYDVVPSVRTDAIGQTLRQSLGSDTLADADDFWIWSDRLYGDSDGDHLAEYPVSRIPDAKEAQLVHAALNARPFRTASWFGVRNVVRPFADAVWPSGAKPGDMQVSQDFLSSQITPEHIQAACHYFMLHGRESDGRVFQGEFLQRAGYPTAFTVANVPVRFDGVVIAGCCWGALVVNEKARDTLSMVPAPRARQASIALSYLGAGAVAFIGCTGAHYSGPNPDPEANYAAQLHKLIFAELHKSSSPAEALHLARGDFLKLIFAGKRGSPIDLARRLKNAHQFTCLGLGW